MNLRKILALFILLIFSVVFNLSAVEFNSGFIKLVLHEETGTYSLYYLTDPATEHYEPLFNDEDPRSSFLSVMIDGKVHRLGKSKNFTTRIERVGANPALVYEAPFLKITEVFSPIRTVGSRAINGVRITITIENTGVRPVSVGLKKVIDTYLGEGLVKNHFYTNNNVISREAIIQGDSGDSFWVSRGLHLSFMGSIAHLYDNSGNAKLPDAVYLANWRRLYRAKWKNRYPEGRSFNNYPYSIRDSAVGYYYDPSLLNNGDSFTYTIFLSTEDVALYHNRIPTFETASWGDLAIEEPENYVDPNYLLLLRLQETLNQFIMGQIQLTVEELDEIERSIDRLRTGY